jgi:hypothetical protein
VLAFQTKTACEKFSAQAKTHRCVGKGYFLRVKDIMRAMDLISCTQELFLYPHIIVTPNCWNFLLLHVLMCYCMYQVLIRHFQFILTGNYRYLKSIVLYRDFEH